jgi:hypothetical protein
VRLEVKMQPIGKISGRVWITWKSPSQTPASSCIGERTGCAKCLRASAFLAKRRPARRESTASRILTSPAPGWCPQLPPRRGDCRIA